jgi:NO-binding membrane sensor protein with MHYT domain
MGTIAIGCGVWTMHFVAMTGFSIAQAGIGYDRLTMLASLGVGVVMIGAGLFVVGYRGATRMAIATGGTLTGLGIASMHYLGMAGLRIQGQIEYSTVTVVASVAVGVAAAVAALYTTARHRGVVAYLVGVACLGGAATGMHYLAMAGSHVHLTAVPDRSGTAGVPDLSLLLPMLAGPVAFLVLAGLVMVFEPQLLAGATPRRTTAPGVSRARTWGAAPPPGHWATDGWAHDGVPGPRGRPRGLPHPPRPAGRQAERAPEPARRGVPDFHDW